MTLLQEETKSDQFFRSVNEFYYLIKRLKLFNTSINKRVTRNYVSNLFTFSYYIYY